MSDILLSVGLQTGATETNQLQTDLQKIISRIDKNPPKVKVGLQVDQSAINHFKSQLTQIVSSVGLSSGSPITVNISGIGEITAQAGKAKSALDGVAKAGKQAADAVNKMGTSQVQTALTQINTQLKTIQTNYAKWTAAANGQSKDFYSTYGQQIQTLETLRQKVEANEISWSQFREELASIKQVASEAATAINKFGEDHTEKKITVLGHNTEEYRKALAKCNSELVTLRKNQEQWTAAKNGKGSDDYSALGQYAKQIEALIVALNTGKMTMDEFKSRFGEIKAAADRSRSSIQGFGEDTKTVGDRLKGLAEKFGIWLSVSQVIMQAVRAIKQMVSAVRDVDAAMTELRKVTDETDAVYDRFLSNASSRAKDVGAAISDIVSATADFARLGYSIEDASALADIAIMYKNIGDGVEDVNQATESIVSTMQAFGMMPEEAMHIVDVFNAIGNNFAISSGGIGDALQRSAAAMNAAGNTLEETAALVAAANTVVQNPDSVGTTLKTVSMFLRASKVEAEEAGESTEGMAHSVSELREQLLTLTDGRVDILLDSGKYKSTYEILKDISSVWDDIVSNQGTDSAAILELIGGKRNANVVAAILENFQIAEDALRVAMESAGSAAIENEKHLDSINGKIEIFKAAFQELSVNLISSDFVKGIVDFGTSLIEILNTVTAVINVLGGLETVLIAIGGIVLTMKIDGMIAGIVAIAEKIKTLTLFTGTFATKFASVYQTSMAFGATRLQSTLNGVSVGFKAVAASASAAQIAVAAFTAAIVVISMLSSAIEQAEAATKAANDALITQAEKSANSAKSLYNLYDAYVQASQAAENDAAAKDAVQQASQELAKALGVEQDAVDGLITSYKGLTTEELADAVSDSKIGVDAAEKNLINEITDFRDSTEEQMMIMWGFYATGEDFTRAATQADQARILVAAYRALVEEQRRLVEAEDTNSVGYKNISDTITLFGPYISKLESAQNTLSSVQEQYNNVVNDMVGGTDDISDAADDLGKESDTVADKLNILKEKLLELTAAYSKWRAAQSGPESGDIYDDSIQALQQIMDGLESGKVGTEKYKASVEFLVPEANREDVSAYVESLKRYITEDAAGVSNFISDAITAGLMVDDGSGNISIVSDATVQDFCNKLTITPDMAQAIFGELEEYGWDMQWSVDDFIDPEVNTEQTESDLQTVQQGVDGISESVDTLNAKTIGDLGASETVVSLLEVIKWMNDIDNKKISDKHVNVYTHEIPADGESSANGTSSAEGGRTLVGELGAELVVSGDRYYLVGQNGAEFVNLKPGDMVFNHIDTQKILTGKSGVRGQALRDGSYDLDLLGISGGGRDIRQDTPTKPGGGGGNTNKGSNKGPKEYEESWFERQYKDHQHWLEMDQESMADYLKWLDEAYKKAYEEGIIDLDEYYKYQEEVYKGSKDLFKDHLNDIEHEISILEAGVGNSDEIINLSLQAIQDIEAELAAAREAGLDENGDYIQWLEQQWMEYHDAVTDLREDAEAESKSTIDDIVEYRIDMLKQEIQDQKDALDEQLDDLRDFYDKQRKMLQDQYDEEKYLEEQNEKRKSVTDLRAELAMLDSDGSAWAQKRKLELQAELSDAEKELSSFEKDHALDMTLDMLDEQQAAQEAQIQAQMDALDEKLNDPHALFNQALEDIKNNTAELYQQFIEYNRKHGTGNDQDIADMWEEAYKADQKYQDTHNGEHLDGIAIGNYTGYIAPENPAPPEPPPLEETPPADPQKDEPKEDPKPSLEKGSSIQVKKSATHFSSKSGGVRMASFVPGGKYTVYKTSGNEVLIGRNGEYTGWINKSDIVGYRSGTSYSIGGLAQFDEAGKGSEYIFESSDGNRYRMFSEGSKVLNADETSFLYNFATSGGGVLMRMLSDLFGLNNFGNISKPIQAIEIHAGDIVVQGNATERTVSEIRRAQRESLDFVIKEFNKLNK